MASGSFKVSTDNGYISGTVSWSSTENVSKNQSTVTATMRLERTNTGYTTYGTGDFFVSIDGTRIWDYDKDFSLTYNSNTFIVSGSKVVTHNSDGSKKITIGWGGDSNVVNVYDSSDSATLDTIPRESSLSSSPNFTAGQNFTVSVSRHSSDFRHEVEIYVQETNGNYNWIGQVALPSNDTSVNSGWGVAEHAEVYRHLAGRSSSKVQFKLQTFDGSTYIGTKDYYGTVTALRASDIPNETNWNVYPDNGIYISISRAHSLFTHTLKIYAGGTLIKTLTGVGSSTTWTPSASEEAAIYAKFPNSTSVDGNIEVYTYYDGELVRGKTDSDINFYIRNSNPSFSSNGVTYYDRKLETVAVTGDNSYIIQGQSWFYAEVPAAYKATALNSASLSKYQATANGVTKDISYSTTSNSGVDFWEEPASSNFTLFIKAIDSRGFSTTQSKTVKVLPYHQPTLKDSIKRLNNFENQTTISVSGNISLLTIGSVNKNSIQYAQYRWKEKTSSTWGSWTNLSLTMNGDSYTATATRDFDNGKSFDVEIKIVDKLKTTLVSRTLSRGRPLFMPDPSILSIGVNMAPKEANSLDIAERMMLFPNLIPSTRVASIFNSDTYKSYFNFKPVEGSNDPAYIMHETSNIAGDENKGVLHLAPTDDNSGTDYVSVHGTNDPEAVNIYTGGQVEIGCGNLAYPSVLFHDNNKKQVALTGINDTLSFRHGANSTTNEVAKLTNRGIVNTAYEKIWSGAAYPMETQSWVMPDVRDCPNGWMFVWSDYNPGGSGENWDWHVTYAHKNFVSNHLNVSVIVSIPNYLVATGKDYTNKFLVFTSNTGVKGHVDNYSDNNGTKDVVLRELWTY